ncbi:efflux RND transporter permease subunit [Aliterella atlantica]|uniref:RND transporter n=1 Tax=Aliterella atlantica CENA595 TaxID=1618023 RepID=A0A0D8ZQ84_9CYAN|nr:efflux RND transporter permease subunit [Aliterella atlantica]KJH70973.1 RND transporter [Aliterella atlantica CENA595]
MFVDFFIKRPIFATVCSLIIILIGAVSLVTLPVENYPDVAPTTITVTSNYTGASAEVVESAVTTVLERQINGVEGMEYLSSTSTSDGVSTVTVTFEQGRNKDIAAVDVQNRVSIASPQLPAEVNQTGVTVAKESGNILLGIGLYAKDGQYDNLFISNYADLYLVDALKRLPGVGNVQIFGERRYAMRLWLDPNRLASRNLTAQDVVDALREQNLQVGAGQIGQQPAPEGQQFQINLQAVSRLKDTAEFADIVLKTGNDGTLVKLKDVGRAELGAQSYNGFLRFSGQEAVGLGIGQLVGSNALDVAREVKAEMQRLSRTFPPGLSYQVAFDTTEAVEESVKEVLITLAIAIVLVILVIYLFLQDWRSTLIPSVTIPVSLIGTFAFIKFFGFSINSLTLFGLILATGLVVDDGIVVIENITRLIEEKGMNPLRAASEAMAEVTGAVIATSLVLMAVFIPVAFFPGVTGELYQQFALTIAFSIVLSTFNALTLTPALAALLLGREAKPQNFFFNGINWLLDKTRRAYARSLRFVTRAKGWVMLAFALLLGATFFLFQIVPSGFVPDEDQGFFATIIQAPEGVSLEYTSDIMQNVEKQLLAVPEVTGTFAVGSFSFGGGGANVGTIFTTLKTWSQRERSVDEIITALTGPFLSIPGAIVLPINPPPVQVGSSLGGFDFQLQDRASAGLSTLAAATQDLVGKANATGKLVRVNSTFAVNAPQLLIEVDRNRAKALQVSLEDIFNTLQTFLGSAYVNDFNLFERTYRVYVQADEQFRSKPEDIQLLYVRSQNPDNPQMIPLSNLVKVTPTVGPQIINHYNLFRSTQITGSPAPGSSSGQAIALMAQLADENLPAGMDYSWSGSSLEEIKSGGLAPLIFGLGFVFVFLVLAAQYESYFDPFIILMAVPLAILGALLAQLLRGLPNDIYCQIGLVMLIGLASKNSILIVEFANQLRDRGYSITKAAVEASQERLRPILMTALSFIFGIFPLLIAEGAGAGARRSLGTAVFGGMVVSTFLSLFIVPVLYIIIGTLRNRWQHKIIRNS